MAKTKDDKKKKKKVADAAPEQKRKVGERGNGYKNHQVGSRKEEIHRLFDEKGEDVARKRGLELELKPGTISGWFGTWRAEAGIPAKGRGGRPKKDKTDAKTKASDAKADKKAKKKAKRQVRTPEDEGDDDHVTA